MKLLVNFWRAIINFFNGLWRKPEFETITIPLHLKPLDKAAYALDKGLVTAPKHLSREDRVLWAYRSRPSSFWR